ncbi:MAG: STAS domain-containing protein [Chloroflexi bacterium]|nr:STAS domain-containing protein [Chloroflexota bacterium]
MKIEMTLTSTDPRFQLLELEGDLDAEGAEILEKDIKKSFGDGDYNIILDFSNCAYLSSTGLRVLFSSLNKVRQNNGRLVLTGVNENVRKLFSVADCEHLFNFHPTLADFLLSLK